MPLDQVLFGRVVAWHRSAILHCLPCATPRWPAPLRALLYMLEPLLSIVFDGELYNLELDS